MTIEKRIFEIIRESGIIRVTATVTHYKQTEKIKKEMEKLGLTITMEPQKVGRITRIPGEYKVPFDDDISGDLNKKLQELVDSGWKVIEGAEKD